jgi:aspartyl-tRNA(Asn)/glutamyl-tRNA(Gln) amidotransferase subunit A
MLTDSQLAFASIATIGKLFRTRKLSPVELTGFLLARIEKLNPQLNAFLTVTAELALKQAARAESELAKGKGRSPRRDRGALHGILVSLKDNIYTAGIRTTAGSQILRNFVPTKDAPVVTALQNSGAVLVGKTNMHEFAYGASNINPHFGPSRNPWDLARITGGSSGGSAAALAAGLCYGSIGTDTGGSIRIPSSLCGVVGLKPSLGSVSTKNVVPLSPSLDVVGPMARTVADVVLLWNTVRPSTSSHVQYSAKSNSARARKPRLGIPKEFFFDLLAPDVAAAYDSAIRSLGKNGAQVKKVSLPLIEMTEEAGNQIAWAEALFYHQQSGWFPARSAEYGEDVRSRLEMGTKVSAVIYLQALQSRERFISQFHSLLEEQNLDALVVPTTPITAPLIDEESISIDGTLHPTRALLLRLNRPANLAGIPAISVPLGMTKNNLPAGLQFIGPLHSDPFLLALSGVFERLRDHSSPAPFPVPPASN